MADLPWVRRASGGAAIVHHHELTYAFALPAGPAWKTAESWVCRMHHLIQAALAAGGVTARGVVCGDDVKLGPVLCFRHQTPADLTVDGSKVVGSAQRKLRGAVLQHGSILLRRSEFVPELSGVNDFAGADVFTPAGLADTLATAFAADTGWAVEPADWTPHEVQRTAEIERDKYANPAWNEKR